jgi:DNA helicase-2/ATP-dependent DNA helicase PcrA
MTVRLIEDLTPLEKLALIDMSYSRLDTYDMCNAKYFYTYIQQEDRVFGEAASLGNIVHGVLENVDWEEPLDLPDMHKTFILQRQVYDPDSVISADLIDTGYKLLTEFVDRHDGEEFNVLGVEVPFAMVVGSALVCGYIDRIDDDGDQLRIIDYKTGKWEATYKGIAENLQLGIYALATSKMHPGREIRAELYYLRSGKRKGHVYTQEDLERVEQSLIERVNKVIDDKNFVYTGNTRVCSFCDFRKSGVCAVGVRRYGGTT